MHTIWPQFYFPVMCVEHLHRSTACQCIFHSEDIARKPSTCFSFRRSWDQSLTSQFKSTHKDHGWERHLLKTWIIAATQNSVKIGPGGLMMWHSTRQLRIFYLMPLHSSQNWCCSPEFNLHETGIFRSNCKDGLDYINLFATAACILEAARKHSIILNSLFHLNGLLTSETHWLPFKAATL